MKRAALSFLPLIVGCFSVPDNQATIRFRFVLLEKQADGSIGALLCADVPPVGQFINTDVATLAIVAKSSRGLEVQRSVTCSYSPEDALISSEDELGLFEADLPSDTYTEINLSLQNSTGTVIPWKIDPDANFADKLNILGDETILLRPENTQDFGGLFERQGFDGALGNELKIFPQIQ